MSSTSNELPASKDPLISVPQVFGSALAAACATAAASYFGIAGTIIGAVAASVIATVVSTTSTHSLKQAPRLAVASAGVLAIVTLAVTGLEGATGRPLSTLMGHDETSAGTTISRAVSGDRTGRAIVRNEVVRERDQVVVPPTSVPDPEQAKAPTDESDPTPATPTEPAPITPDTDEPVDPETPPTTDVPGPEGPGTPGP